MKVLTVGTFDIFHAGHVFLLEQCRKLAPEGDVGVGVNTDEFTATFKDSPIQRYHERATVVAACKYVDRVIPNDDASLCNMLTVYNPDFLVVGQDWVLKDYYSQIGTTQAWLNEHGISLLYVPRPEGTASSTDIKERIQRRMPKVQPYVPVNGPWERR